MCLVFEVEISIWDVRIDGVSSTTIKYNNGFSTRETFKQCEKHVPQTIDLQKKIIIPLLHIAVTKQMYRFFGKQAYCYK